MVSPPRAGTNLLLVLVLWCLCCAPLTCKKKKPEGNARPDIRKSFQMIAEKEGDPNTISFNELREDIMSDGSSSIKNMDPEILKNVMAEADFDKDGELSFLEYMTFHIKCKQRILNDYGIM